MRGQPMLAVAGIGPLRAVADVKVLVQLQPGQSFEDRHADLAGAARIDGGFVDHDTALAQCLADRFGGHDQRRQVRPVRPVDRRRHRDDEDAAPTQRCRDRRSIRCARLALRSSGSTSSVESRPREQFVDPLPPDVETDHRPRLGELHGQRQADITEPDHARSSCHPVASAQRAPPDPGCTSLRYQSMKLVMPSLMPVSGL